MKKLIVALLCAGSLSALAVEAKTDAKAETKTWSDVAISCEHCKGKVKKDPDSHDRACMMKCESSGYGVFSADGTFLSFDKAGNEKAIEALKKSDKKDHVRCTVTGEQDGDTIKVSSITVN